MKLGTNVPMGPLELADHIGLDVVLTASKTLQDHLGDRYRPAYLPERKVEAGTSARRAAGGATSTSGDPSPAGLSSVRRDSRRRCLRGERRYFEATLGGPELAGRKTPAVASAAVRCPTREHLCRPHR